MDISRFMNIIEDINNEEDGVIETSIRSLINSINSSNSVEISKSIELIEREFSISAINSYNPSNLLIIEKIGAHQFCGNYGLNKFEEILKQDSYNVSKTVGDLEKYLEDRKKFISLISETYENLDKLNIKSYYHYGNTFEVGLLMPTDFTNKKIPKITKELNHWDKIFKTIKELTATDTEDTELSFVSNGSLQFFIDNIPEVSACLAVTIERIIKVYKNIIEIRSTREKLKELGISTVEQKSIEKQEKEMFNTEIDKITTDIVKEFAVKNIEKGRINELKIAFKGHVTHIAKCIDGGMIIEITPPIVPPIQKTVENEENKDEIKQIKANYEKTLKQIEVVQKSMDTLKTIQSTGIEVMTYLTEKGIINEDDVDEN